MTVEQFLTQITTLETAIETFRRIATGSDVLWTDLYRTDVMDLGEYHLDLVLRTQYAIEYGFEG